MYGLIKEPVSAEDLIADYVAGIVVVLMLVLVVLRIRAMMTRVV